MKFPEPDANKSAHYARQFTDLRRRSSARTRDQLGQRLAPPLHVHPIVIVGVNRSGGRIHEERFAVAVVPDAEAARQAVERESLFEQNGRHLAIVLRIARAERFGVGRRLVSARVLRTAVELHCLDQLLPVVRSPVPAREVEYRPVPFAQNGSRRKPVEKREVLGRQGLPDRSREFSRHVLLRHRIPS